jgi:hypothetical protein
MEEIVDTQSGTEGSTEVNTEMNHEVQTDDAQQQAQETEEERYKIKVNGEELEVTKPELIKYAQLGKAGQRAMERAALAEKSQKQMYSQLIQAADKDIYALYEVLTGKKHPHATQFQNNGTQETAQVDPRDLELREYKERLSALEAARENEAVEKERVAIENELGEAVKKYPELDSPYMKHFVKSEYRKALMNGIDLSLDDVAFYVSQDVKKSNAEKQKATVQKIEENKKRAPVITPPAGGNGKKAMTLEDVKKLAGRI